MKKYALISILAIFLVSGLIVSVSAADSYGNNYGGYDSNFIDGLNVSYDLEQSLKDAKLENKTVMVVFDQDSCGYCDMLKQDTLSDSDVQKIINENCIPVIIDINKDYEIASQFDVFGTPLIIFLDGDGKELHRIEGYVTPDEFLSEVHG